MAWELPKGEDFLPKLGISRLREMYAAERGAKPKMRLLCAIHRKEGRSIDEIASITNMKRRTVHETLRRFAQRGVSAKNSIRQNGRPPLLNLKQRKALARKLGRGPPRNRDGLWTTREVRDLVKKEYGVEYTPVHIWGLLKALGFSLQRPRPKHHKGPSPDDVARFKKKLRCWQSIAGAGGS